MLRSDQPDFSRLTLAQRAALSHVHAVVCREEIGAHTRMTNCLNRAGCRPDDYREAMECVRVCVMQGAVIHVQSSGREEVTGANVLVAMFAERESRAVHFLQEQGMTRYDGATSAMDPQYTDHPRLAEFFSTEASDPRDPRNAHNELSLPRYCSIRVTPLKA